MMESAKKLSPSQTSQTNRYPRPCRTSRVPLLNWRDPSFRSKISSRSLWISSMTKSSSSSTKVSRPPARSSSTCLKEVTIISETKWPRLSSTFSSKSKYCLLLYQRRKSPAAKKAWSTLISSWSRLSTSQIRSFITRSKRSRCFWPSLTRRCLMSWGTPLTL